MFEKLYKSTSTYNEQALKIKKLSDEIATLNDTYLSTCKAIDDDCKKISTLLALNSSLEEKNSALSYEILLIKSKLLKISDFENKLEQHNRISDELFNLNKQKLSLMESISALKNKIAEASEKNKFLENENDSLSSSLFSLKTQLYAINEQIEYNNTHLIYCTNILNEKKQLFKAQYMEAKTDFIGKIEQLNKDFVVAAKEYDLKKLMNEYENIRNYISEEEFFSLDCAQRYQLALDRYFKRTKNNASIGLDYERYIGYLCEINNYVVRYNGAVKTLKDNGIDLVVSDKNNVYLIQCKYWKDSAVLREKYILLIHGGLEYFKETHTTFKNKKAFAVLCTSASLSEEAREAAKTLNVITLENYKIAPYPTIKCNISKKDKQKIYHMPYDQMYDTVFINPKDGDFYAWTTLEAEEKGFRHAHAWNPKKLYCL